HHYQEGHQPYVILKPAGMSSPKDAAGLPVPPPELWGDLGESAEEYLASGRMQVETMLQITGAASLTLTPAHRSLDFGCRGGRLRRWVEGAAGGEIGGTDIDARPTVWCQQPLSPPLKFTTTTTYPHVPFEDGYFDFIYSVSAFPYHPDLADAWLLELKRVLRP